MFKALCVAVLLVPIFAIAQTTKASTTPPFASPVIVAKGKFVNQTAPIPTTTIFTPPQTGLYRLSVYATLTKSDPASLSSWSYGVNWTDDTGAQQYGGGVQFAAGNSPTGQFTFENFFDNGGPTVVFEAKAQTPITSTMTQIGPPDNSAYSLYYTLERLE